MRPLSANASTSCERGEAVPVCLIGNLGGQSPGQDGQTLRTRLVATELARRLGGERVRCVDTHEVRTRPLATLRHIRRGFRDAERVVIMPAERGLKYLLPFYCYWRWRHAVPVHYLVVGGWLPAFLDSHPWLRRGLRRLDSLHVQSRRMIAQLKRQGFENLHWLPNFRDFPPQGPVSRGIGDPVRLVFLSRMIPEKGADLAVAAVAALNAARERPGCTLDLYGPVADDHQAWLSQLLQGHGDAIAYRGPLAPDAVLETLSRYDALLFPTRYAGEGFPGVIVEAYAAGLAVIASDWQDNGEVVSEGTTGLLFPSGEAAALEQRLDWLIRHPRALLAMKSAARATAARYHVDTVIPELLGTLEVPVTPGVGNAEEVPQ